MEVMMMQPDFDFPSSATASPCSSTPQSPARYFFSAPTSPARLSDFYRQFDAFSLGAPKPTTATATAEKELLLDDDNDDFAFDFSEDLERASLSADELFDGGVIKPVVTINPPRGRDHTRSLACDPSVLRSSRRATRSLSPIRESSQLLHSSYKQQQQLDDGGRRRGGNNNKTQQKQQQQHQPVPKLSSASKKWRLRDFLLFRSASEGRAAERDPLRKYYYSKYNRAADRNDGGSESLVRRRGGGPAAMSAHGRHYTANKAVSEDLKKKTFLPYKQGILGRLSFNPALHAIANGFGSFTRA